MKSASLKKQIFMFYTQRVFSEPSFLGPVIGLFLLSRGLDFMQIMILQVLFNVAFAASQLPTGIIADKFGRKTSLILGSLLLGFSLFLLTLPNINFLVFILSEVLFGIGLAFRSGADVALMYTFMEKNDAATEYSKLEGNANFYLGISSAVCSITAGYLYSLNAVYPIIASAIWPIICIIPTLMLHEMKEHKIHNKNQSHMAILREGYQNVIESSRLKTILVYSVIFLSVFNVTFWFYPPSMIAFNINPIYYGWIFLALNIVYSLAAKYGTRFVNATKGYSLMALFLVLALGILICGVLGASGSMLFIIFFIPDQLVRGWFPVVYNKFINKYIKDNIRATVLSFMSTVQQVFSAGAKLLFGYVLSRYEIFNIRIATGLILLVAAVILFRYLRKNLNEKTNKE